MNAQLTTQLFEQTATLRVQFIAKSKAFARKEFADYEDMATWTYDRFLDVYGVNVYWKHGKVTRTLNKKGYSLYTSCRNVIRAGLDAYLAKAEEAAANHYKNSILKLALRLEEKGCTGEFTMSTSHIDVNIATVISFADKTVVASTIIASGPVQKPHYRYLVK